VPSERTLRKRFEERRAWTVTTLAGDGKWYQKPWAASVVSGKVQRVRIPGKRERAVMRALAEASRGQEQAVANDGADAVLHAGDGVDAGAAPGEGHAGHDGGDGRGPEEQAHHADGSEADGEEEAAEGR
jgi:hypothetical protein